MKKIALIFLLFLFQDSLTLDDDSGIGDFELIEHSGNENVDNIQSTRDIESGNVEHVDISMHQERNKLFKRTLRKLKMHLNESTALKKDVLAYRRSQECVCIWFIALCLIVWWKTL